jgi:hypothetical protein
MKRLKLEYVVITGLLLFSIIHTVSATVIIDPIDGWSGSFAWDDGLGHIDYINYSNNDIDWSITASKNSQMSFATAYDWYLPGDEFEFVLDGVALGWDATFIDSNGYFHGKLSDLYLSAGTHLLTINVTAVSSPYPGVAYAEFGGLAEVMDSTGMSIPEPAILPLITIGLLLMMGFRQKAL